MQPLALRWPPPPKLLGDLGDIDLSFAADAEAELAGVGDLAKKDSGFDAGDADEVVDDAFAVLGVRRRCDPCLRW